MKIRICVFTLYGAFSHKQTFKPYNTFCNYFTGSYYSSAVNFYYFFLNKGVNAFILSNFHT